VSKTDDKQSNADVLRAADIVPPYNKGISQKRDSQEKRICKREAVSSQNKRKQPLKEEPSPCVGKKQKRIDDLSVESANAVQQTREIPKFDLTEQIMAEQRKIAAIRRKGPDERPEAPKPEQQVESIGRSIRQTILSEQEQIIAEIVARDIEKLCRGNTLNSV